MIVGLNLLRLLVQNRIAEFHTDLELLSPEVGKYALIQMLSSVPKVEDRWQILVVLQMQQNEYVKLATQLEQWLMEGSYNKVWGT